MIPENLYAVPTPQMEDPWGLGGSFTAPSYGIQDEHGEIITDETGQPITIQ
jgi:hypothetical protein